MASDPSVDFNVETGADIAGWPHVLQCIEDFFTTEFGERVIREWYGSAVPRFLGENMNVATIVPFFSAISSAIIQWEPRYLITRVLPESVGRDGKLRIVMEGVYRPRALLGDFTPDGSRRVVIAGGLNSRPEVIDGN